MKKPNKTVEFLSILEMVGFLKTNGTSCRFVSLVSDTPVVKIRKGHPFPGLHKVSRKVGLINANFNTSVRRRIAEQLGVELSEVEYENGEVWYKHLLTSDGKPLPVLVNKSTPEDGKFYLQLFTHKSQSVYVSAGGEVVPSDLVKPWLYKESPRPDFKPTVISLKLEHVKNLKASGVIVEFPGFDKADELLASDGDPSPANAAFAEMAAKDGFQWNGGQPEV